jgi:hypothetical protein
MNTYLEEQLAHERLEEARAIAAHSAILRDLAPVRRPMRVAVGRALIRAGHLVAGRAPRRSQPSRVTA